MLKEGQKVSMPFAGYITHDMFLSEADKAKVDAIRERMRTEPGAINNPEICMTIENFGTFPVLKR